MPSYIQIGDDPTKWWIGDQIPTNELTEGQPLSFTCLAPIEGLLVLSPRSAAAVTVPAAPRVNTDIPQIDTPTPEIKVQGPHQGPKQRRWVCGPIVNWDGSRHCHWTQ